MTPEEYIKACTRGCSNELIKGGYHDWLTPKDALAAVELAREEIHKKLFRISMSSNPMDYVKGVSDLLKQLEENQ